MRNHVYVSLFPVSRRDPVPAGAAGAATKYPGTAVTRSYYRTTSHSLKRGSQSASAHTLGAIGPWEYETWRQLATGGRRRLYSVQVWNK